MGVAKQPSRPEGEMWILSRLLLLRRQIQIQIISVTAMERARTIAKIVPRGSMTILCMMQWSLQRCHHVRIGVSKGVFASRPS